MAWGDEARPATTGSPRKATPPNPGGAAPCAGGACTVARERGLAGMSQLSGRGLQAQRFDVLLLNDRIVLNGPLRSAKATGRERNGTLTTSA